MTDIEKLITAARHYCIDNFAFWSDKYAKENNELKDSYSANDYNIFPRYHVIQAIGQGVEILVGQEFQSFEDCRQQLADTGLRSHSISTIDSNAELHLLGERGRFRELTGRLNKIEKNAIKEEREKFIDFVNSRTIDNVSAVEPLGLLWYDNQSVKQKFHSPAQTPATRLYN